MSPKALPPLQRKPPNEPKALPINEPKALPINEPKAPPIKTVWLAANEPKGPPAIAARAAK